MGLMVVCFCIVGFSYTSPNLVGKFYETWEDLQGFLYVRLDLLDSLYSAVADIKVPLTSVKELFTEDLDFVYL